MNSPAIIFMGLFAWLAMFIIIILISKIPFEKIAIAWHRFITEAKAAFEAFMKTNFNDWY